MRTLFIFSLLLVMVLPCHSQTTWTPYSSNITFKIKNAGFTVSGTFDTVATTLAFRSDKPDAGSLSGIAKSKSINTGMRKRDEHLRKEEFFDVEKFPTIEIKSVKLYSKDIKYAGLFNITIKGVTKQIEIPFEFNPLANEAEFKGSFTINRRDYNIGTSSMILGDTVTIDFDIKAKK